MKHEKRNLIKIFKELKLIDQLIHEKKLVQTILKKNITLYCGFDPTSDSLHVGHLIPLFLLKTFQNFGHKPIILVGGATSLIGDPSFRDSERSINQVDQIESWTRKIYNQIGIFFDSNHKKNKAIIVNNIEWFERMKIIDFLTTVGRNFSIKNMLRKELIKNKLENRQGISFSEFSYSLLQAYDFYKLYTDYHASLQIGGSDQWSNIIVGIELIKKLSRKEVFGLTFSLITNSIGRKFGKTEKNNIWLDPKKTSPYCFYQFWINLDDRNAQMFFYLLLMSNSTLIHNLEMKKYPKKIQYFLAKKVTEIIHGKYLSDMAHDISKKIFEYQKISQFKEEDFRNFLKLGVPKIEIDLSRRYDIQEILVKSKLLDSKSQARNMIENHSISVNFHPCEDKRFIFSENEQIFQRYSIVRKGKKDFILIVWKKVK
ncbi:tyrosine--tRNA ligase [Candidatus Riesia pediculicola]|uniref:Tyrosine--tRNA ligase n=1 Tax=Riesia pediculicola (strain USDA) TaxID=515618 RepID=D4G7T7_RIEPU|nr:tyrosine--tRNA ligase [Candidatus Riesia pediculicola]ADD79480.1 tyrosyl-tRNA synthetase [Candidatus Riesia pediculicola USDA]ARC53656.1 hypothetical protein AOE55_00595 [Candidatus Riesia pediculicola]QOJ86304.1 tyrosine--tRNA ligase [Candidatus Riesia pediculicola]